MATWGVPAIGRYVKVSPEERIKRGVVYESRFRTEIDIPDEIELPLLTAFRKLSDWVAGTETRYIYVKGRDVRIQWVSEGSPALIETVITAIIAIAVLFAIYLVLTAVYQIVSYFDPQTAGNIFQLMFLMMIMYFSIRIMQFLRWRR